MNINISVVDDHNLYRKGLINILNTFEEISSIKEFENGEHFIASHKEDSFSNHDIVLLDYQMPKLNGLEVCSWLKINRPKIKIIMLSQYMDNQTINKCIQHGASAYLLKTISIMELHEAIIQVHNNDFYFNEICTAQSVISILQKDNTNSLIKDIKFTKREKEIIGLICKELSYKEIANKLTISIRTVEKHKDNILEKIGATKVTGIIIYASKKGWVY